MMSRFLSPMTCSWHGLGSVIAPKVWNSISAGSDKPGRSHRTETLCLGAALSRNVLRRTEPVNGNETPGGQNLKSICVD